MPKELKNTKGDVIEEFTDEQIEELAQQAWENLCELMGANGPVNDVQIFVKELEVIQKRLDQAFAVAVDAYYEEVVASIFS